MATHASTGTYTNNSDAAFRAWTTDVHNALIAAGFVQTADTGQIAFASVLKPTAVNTIAGYAMYRFADALQSTAPIFIKIEFGMGATLDTTIGWRITVGTQTDGAGVVGGVNVVTPLVSQPVSNYPGVNNNWACHTAGAGWIVFDYESGTYGCVLGFAVFRTQDDAGALSGEGATVYFRAASTSAGTASALRFVTTAGVLVNQGSAIPALFPHAMTDYKVGVDVQFFPHWTVAPRVRLNPFAFAYVDTDLTHGSPITTTAIDGVSRTYMPLTGYAITAAGAGATAAAHSTAYVWQ